MSSSLDFLAGCAQSEGETKGFELDLVAAKSLLNIDFFRGETKMHCSHAEACTFAEDPDYKPLLLKFVFCQNQSVDSSQI